MSNRQPTLLDVPKDSPSGKQLLDAFKREHGIETHYCRGLDDPWMACHMPTAQEIANGYGMKLESLMDAVARLCRILEERGVITEDTTERKAIERLCENLEMRKP